MADPIRPSDTTLLSLPDELLLDIVSRLDVASRFAALETCTRLSSIVSDYSTWQTLEEKIGGDRVDLKTLRTFLEMHGKHLKHTSPIQLHSPVRKLINSPLCPQMQERIARGRKLLKVIDDPEQALPLINAGVALNWEHYTGRVPGRYETLLTEAISQGQPEIVAALLTAGADPTHCAGYWESPLEFAIKRNCKRSLELLLARRPRLKHPEQNLYADVAPRSRATLFPPLINHRLPFSGEYVSTLLRESDTASATLLIASGLPFDLDAPLLSATYFGQTAIVEQLLEMGANPNCTNIHGFPPLFIAIEQNQVEEAALLLTFGADRNAWRQGKQAADYARAEGKEEIAALCETVQHTRGLPPPSISIIEVHQAHLLKAEAGTATLRRIDPPPAITVTKVPRPHAFATASDCTIL